MAYYTHQPDTYSSKRIMRDTALVPHSNVCIYSSYLESGREGGKRESGAKTVTALCGSLLCSTDRLTFPLVKINKCNFPSFPHRAALFFLVVCKFCCSFHVLGPLKARAKRTEGERGVDGRRRLVHLFTSTKPYQVPLPFFPSSL